MSDAAQWAKRLGMAASTLFPSSMPRGEHFAMLDGRRASFVYSKLGAADLAADVSRNWQWSADLAHHVFVTDSEVHVRSGRDSTVRKFKRDSVETQLEEFLNFLDSSRHSALPDVVPFLVQEFQSVWANTEYVEGDKALAAFLLVMQAAGESDAEVLGSAEWRDRVAAEIGVDGIEIGGVISVLNEDARRMRNTAPLGLKLISPLVLRHVAGRLFQEAHAVLESVQYGLFGGSTVVAAPTYSQAAAYFTPVPIARMVAEWAVQERSPLPTKLTVADFACGSGVFLTECLRALDRSGFTGHVEIIGRDKSAQAITMAKVAVRGAQRDLLNIKIAVDIGNADAMYTDWPKADIVLMNPPFRSWERMSEREREWVYEVTNQTGRPDLSVGFIERALDSLNKSGVFATLLPAGVLASDGMFKWRRRILDRATPSLVAVLGEHDLFQHALVNVGILALNSGPAQNGPVHLGWSSVETGSAAKLVRAVRRSMTSIDGLAEDHSASWSLAKTSFSAWLQRPSWLPGAGALGSSIDRILSSMNTKVETLFTVRQGIRTGANDVFIQSAGVVNSFPKSEQKYFREAVDARSFNSGAIHPVGYVFVPDQKWSSEQDVQRAVPRFFAEYLEPNRERLTRRKRKSMDNSRWWELTWPRSWAFDGRPRLVSKRFGLYPAFARDLQGRLAIVQANAWIPTDTLASSKNPDLTGELLTPYWWILNSRVAVALFREFCPNVAGGQLDLEHKYVKHVPLPNLALRIQEDPGMQSLASSIRSTVGDGLPSIEDRDRFAAAAFQTDISDWNFTGLG